MDIISVSHQQRIVDVSQQISNSLNKILENVTNHNDAKITLFLGITNYIKHHHAELNTDEFTKEAYTICKNCCVVFDGLFFVFLCTSSNISNKFLPMYS